MMKGDAMRRSGELLMILQWIAAFVGIWGFFGSVYDGVLPNGFVGLC